MFSTRSTSLCLLVAFLAGGALAQNGGSQCVNTCINQVVSNSNSGCAADDSDCVCADQGFQPCLTQQCQGQNNPANAYCNDTSGSSDDGSSDSGDNNNNSNNGDNNGSNGGNVDYITTTATVASTTTWLSTWPTTTTTFTGTGYTASSYYSVSSVSSQSTASTRSIASVSSSSASYAATHHSGAATAANIGGGYAGAVAVVFGAVGLVVGGLVVA